MARVRRSTVWKALLLAVVGAPAGAVAFRLAFPLPMTFEDFHLSGTQLGSVGAGTILPASDCAACHANFSAQSEPFATWSGSLMGQAGRDPLFFAQMATANQDVANAGYFCMRCHVPNSFVTASAYDPSGDSLSGVDFDGVSCHFCHSMVDPVFVPGVSPPQDEAILAALGLDAPHHYGNAMFVLDPTGLRRGPRPTIYAPHAVANSAFHTSGNFCGTCHDVGNVATTLQPDGTYRYNALDQRTPTEDLAHQFPLERTYTEWKLSAFANGGVDMGGRFGGVGVSRIESCQDCHMPRVQSRTCVFGPVRPDAASHSFAGASSWVLEMIKEHTAGDPAVNPAHLDQGIAAARDMLTRAATLELQQVGSSVRLRVINETGHKLPTGHIEGRRVWLNVRVFDEGGALLREYGRYDADEAHLDEESTVIYEMHVGLSADAAAITGLAPGVTTHMALADTIVKDTRIPPRGWNADAYAAAGAPAVGADYPDGQHWSDVHFALPPGAARVEATVNYQTVTRHYIEALRDGNTTNHWGTTLHSLWERTNKGAPVRITSGALQLAEFRFADLNGDLRVDSVDLVQLLSNWNAAWSPGDLTGDGRVNSDDLASLLGAWAP